MNEDRRKFLGYSLAGLALTAGASVIYSLYHYLLPVNEIASTQKVTIPVADMRDGDAKMFELNGIAGVLIKKEGGAFAAFYAICTHLGCVVQWQKEKGQFLCPCHAGLFSSDGAVLAGPPPKPLSKIPFTHANGVVSIG